jgi:5-formyltetrahydrofolate cyclo-ligase
MEEERKSLKKSFRQGCLKRLKRAAGQGVYRKDKKVLERLRRVIETENARTIMLYLPLSTEVDLYPLIRRLRREGRRLYVPFMEGASFRLVKYRYPLRTKRFGIKEPGGSRQYRNRQIDLAVVPIVGMDATYRRVGFGKGMYDRFFEKEIKNIKKVVFVARELCYSQEIVTDHYDVKADMVIVP